MDPQPWSDGSTSCALETSEFSYLHTFAPEAFHLPRAFSPTPSLSPTYELLTALAICLPELWAIFNVLCPVFLIVGQPLAGRAIFLLEISTLCLQNIFKEYSLVDYLSASI